MNFTLISPAWLDLQTLFYFGFSFSSIFLLHSVFPLITSHSVVLVENIPEDISFLDNGTSHVPLSEGLFNLLDRANRAVEIVSPLWLLNSSDYESSFQPAARQVQPEQANRDLTVQKCVWILSLSTTQPPHLTFIISWKRQKAEKTNDSDV